MMNEDGVRVTRIDWKKSAPSLRLFEAIAFAISPKVFLPACALLGVVHLTERLQAAIGWGPRSADAIPPFVPFTGMSFPGLLIQMNRSLTSLAVGTYSQLATGFAELACLMLLLGFFGVAAMRSVGVVFCSETGSGVVNSARLAARQWRSIGLSTLLTGILLGLLLMLFWCGSWIGLKTHVSVTAGAAVLYVVGCAVLAIGWLLSLAAIAVDRCAGAEALSRGISYVLSRWLRVIVYLIMMTVILGLCDWAISWVLQNASVLTSSVLRSEKPAISAHASGFAALRFLSEALRLSLVFSGIVVSYVLLRHVEDGVSMREIDGSGTQ